MGELRPQVGTLPLAGQGLRPVGLVLVPTCRIRGVVAATVGVPPTELAVSVPALIFGQRILRRVYRAVGKLKCRMCEHVQDGAWRAIFQLGDRGVLVLAGVASRLLESL